MPQWMYLNGKWELIWTLDSSGSMNTNLEDLCLREVFIHIPPPPTKDSLLSLSCLFHLLDQPVRAKVKSVAITPSKAPEWANAWKSKKNQQDDFLCPPHEHPWTGGYALRDATQKRMVFLGCCLTRRPSTLGVTSPKRPNCVKFVQNPSLFKRWVLFFKLLFTLELY
jgi:hypothetical protein